MTSRPVAFELHESGGAAARDKSRPGGRRPAGARTPFELRRREDCQPRLRDGTLDAATWGAELAVGDGRGRIYIVEPLGAMEDDPNVTDKKFPGNPTRSYRTCEPVKVVGELVDWVSHSPEQLQAMREGLADLGRRGPCGHLRLGECHGTAGRMSFSRVARSESGSGQRA